VGDEREAGFDNRIPTISGAGASGRERGVGAGNAAHERAGSTWPEGGGDVGAAAVAGVAARRERREVGEGPDKWAPPVGDPGRGGRRGGLAGPRPAAGPARGRGKKRREWAGGPFGKRRKKRGKRKRKRKKDFPWN
jgi:hypothetical protein